MNPDFDDDLEDDWVDEADDDPADDVLQCPSCRATVHEDTQQCPHCGDWITPVYPRSRWGRWVLVMIVLLLSAALIGLTAL
jgi:hypothetical protein